MGIRDFLRLPVQKMVSGLPQARGWYWNLGGIDADYEIGTTYADFEKAYKDEVWVQRCVNLLANTIASVPIKLYKYEGDKKEEVKEHPIIKLLADVNPLTMNASDLWKATVSGLKIYGNSYWYLERRGMGEPQEIYLLKPSNVEIHGASEPDKYIDYFDYQTGNIRMPKVRYSPNDIIHFKYFNPESEYYGLSPLSCIREAISADLYAQAWNKYFFKNSARPDGFFITKSTLTDEQRRVMKKSIEAQFRGVSKSHKVAVLEEGMDYKQISATPKDAEWSELRRACREAICSALGVPPVLVVAYEAATYATAIEQKKSLWHENIIPELHYFEEVLNWNLVTQFKNMENMRLEFNLTDVPALQEETSSRYERLFRAVGTPYLTVNEVRDTLGLNRLEGGDKLYVPLNMIEGGAE